MTRHKAKPAKDQRQGGGLHPRNPHRLGYDFSSLVDCHRALKPYVQANIAGNLTIDFANSQAVKTLNAALLKQYYNIGHWDIPEGSLCPPIPGRADYIHYIADLLEIGGPASNAEPSQGKITLLDIGTGANGIYPLLAIKIYGWNCVGSDINPDSLGNVTSIIARNPELKEHFTLRTQHNKHQIFEGVIQAGETFDVSVCNPPFHASAEEALKSNQRKLYNLAQSRSKLSPTRDAAKHTLPHNSHSSHNLNFGGQATELWCNGGERMFLKKLIRESAAFATQCRWFTCLVSKSENLIPATKWIRKLGATDLREIKMTHGNKLTRILAWTYL